MAMDTGDRIDPSQIQIKGKEKILEIQINDPVNGEKSWC